jgi:hypothetical protein
MKTEMKLKFNVPMNVGLDVFKALLTNELEFRITGIDELENSVNVQISSQADEVFLRKAVANIEDILRSYRAYLSGCPGD